MQSERRKHLEFWKRRFHSCSLGCPRAKNLYLVLHQGCKRAYAVGDTLGRVLRTLLRTRTKTKTCKVLWYESDHSIDLFEQNTCLQLQSHVQAQLSSGISSLSVTGKLGAISDSITNGSAAQLLSCSIIECSQGREALPSIQPAPIL